MSSPIAVLGAGSWGTALAIHLARNQQTVHLWGNNAEHLQAMQRARCNSVYLPDIRFPDNIEICSDLAHALSNVQDILIAVPSHAFRETLTKIKPFIAQNARLVWATKGLDPLHHQLLHYVSDELLGERSLAVLSGPSFAKEVAAGLPTAITLAANASEFSEDLIKRFHSPNFRVYHTKDMIGVELGGAMKNVLAIAVGTADGLGFGANARAALITRGLAEMVRLGLALGGQRETFMGLAGMGDLVLTCTDNQSRNRRLGLALGMGKTIETAMQEIHQVIEGIQTAAEIYHLAKSLSIEVPITEQVYQILHQGLAPQIAVNNLLTREPKAESI